eukprot:snap_masked-scaffold857_size87770-processed-gene-0.1 protein:Tk01664 transcript:snap_masked-scaffold857_size87770-processed-gene-0.1-mRNA-1 annotation:"alkylated dna repair protein alkb-like protein 5"
MADDDEYIFDHRMGMRLRKPKADVNPNLPADVADAHRHKILSTVANKRIFADYECHRIEDHIDQVVATAITGGFRPATLDRAPLRTKYVFGEGFAYGREVSTQPGVAQEKVYPRGEVDPIPMWLLDMVIRPIVQAGIIPKDFVNSVTIVDCMPGGWITPHIDPTQIFDRPIVIASFVSDSLLSFGSKFTYLPQVQASPPVATVPLTRGNVLGMGGYAANNVDYCIRPEDVPQRQAVIILRRVSHTAPRLSATELVALRENGLLPKEGQLNEPAHRSLPPSPGSLDFPRAIAQEARPVEILRFLRIVWRRILRQPLRISTTSAKVLHEALTVPIQGQQVAGSTVIFALSSEVKELQSFEVHISHVPIEVWESAQVKAPLSLHIAINFKRTEEVVLKN